MVSDGLHTSQALSGVWEPEGEAQAARQGGSPLALAVPGTSHWHRPVNTDELISLMPPCRAIESPIVRSGKLRHAQFESMNVSAGCSLKCYPMLSLEMVCAHRAQPEKQNRGEVRAGGAGEETAQEAARGPRRNHQADG